MNFCEGTLAMTTHYHQTLIKSYLPSSVTPRDLAINEVPTLCYNHIVQSHLLPSSNITVLAFFS